MNTPVIAYCANCDKRYDISGMDFISDDADAIVLDVQMKDPTDMQEAIHRIETHLGFEFEGRPRMFHHEETPTLIHDEFDPEHNLSGVSSGYWGIE